MSLSTPYISSLSAAQIRYCGIVQGVGFRPAVWAVAHQMGLAGSVYNDGDGVLVILFGSTADIDKFISTLKDNYPPLAQVRSVRCSAYSAQLIPDGFSIISSQATQAHTQLPADAATCPACLGDIQDPANRRYRYAFSNCTHCGPRLSIIKGIPYDRAQTSMSAFELCGDCLAEYHNPADRRFHAQPNACVQCGPQLWLEDHQGNQLARNYSAIEQLASLLKAGEIVAIKGIAGIHLAVDASNDLAIKRLRQRKHRPRKALALMAKNMAQIQSYCLLTEADEQQISSSAAPIVLLPRRSNQPHSQIAPGQNMLGFMLPYSPLHHLLMALLDAPIVLTSGNLSGEPQCTDNQQATSRLQAVAEYYLLHDRRIENRLDDSVLRLMAGQHRVLRRARGYAPQPLPMPEGFANCVDLLAMGSELKNTFCLLKDQQAIVSQHMGDLENYATYQDMQKNHDLYAKLFQHKAECIVVDKHPEYLSSKLGKQWAQQQGIRCIEVQHQHAHIAACLLEHQQPVNINPVLGIVLDGLGFGDDDTLWGGEFLLADYRQSVRLAHLQTVPLLGGSKAMYEPWRNLYAQLHSCGLWDQYAIRYGDLDVVRQLQQKPLKTLDQMLKQGVNCPLASSSGRLFDAVAAAIGICSDAITYEGQAAIELEALVSESSINTADQAYAFELHSTDAGIVLQTHTLWQALFADLAQYRPAADISARFHYGLADALVRLSKQLIKQHAIEQVVLSGGVFQNKTLLEAVVNGLQSSVKLLIPEQLPANDGGIAAGQAAVAAAQLNYS